MVILYTILTQTDTPSSAEQKRHNGIWCENVTTYSFFWLLIGQIGTMLQFGKVGFDSGGTKTTLLSTNSFFRLDFAHTDGRFYWFSWHGWIKQIHTGAACVLYQVVECGRCFLLHWSLWQRKKGHASLSVQLSFTWSMQMQPQWRYESNKMCTQNSPSVQPWNWHCY